MDADTETSEQRRARKEALRAHKRRMQQKQQQQQAAAAAAAAAAQTSSDDAAPRAAKRARSDASAAPTLVDASSSSDDDEQRRSAVASDAATDAATDVDSSAESRRARKATRRAEKAAKQRRKADRAAHRLAKQQRRAARAAAAASAAAGSSDSDAEQAQQEDDDDEAPLSEYVDSSSEGDDEGAGGGSAAASQSRLARSVSKLSERSSSNVSVPVSAPVRFGSTDRRDSSLSQQAAANAATFAAAAAAAASAPVRALPQRQVPPDDPTVESAFYRRRGPFTPRERKRVHAAVHAWREAHGMMDDAEWVALCTVRRGGDRDREKHSSAWTEIGAALPLRSTGAVREYCQRRFQDKTTGKWSSEEVDQLRSLVDAYGDAAWTAVGEELRRLPDDCRDKWRLVRDPSFGVGSWSMEEDRLLAFWVWKQSALVFARRKRGPDETPFDPEEITAIQAMRPEDPFCFPDATPLPAKDIAWTVVQQVVKRPHSSCRLRWYQVLLPRLALGSERLSYTGLRWTPDEDLSLLDRIWAQGCEHANEIDWARCVSDIAPAPLTVAQHFKRLLAALTSARRYAPLARPDAPLDTIVRKIRKHLLATNSPIFTTRTFESRRGRRRPAANKRAATVHALAILRERAGAGADDDAWDPEMPTLEDDGSMQRHHAKAALALKRGRGRAEHGGGGSESDATMVPAAATMDPAEVAALRADQERAERQRLRHEAASAALVQSAIGEREKAEARAAAKLAVAERKARRKAEQEALEARAVESIRRKEEQRLANEEAAARAKANRAAAMQAYRGGAGAAAAVSGRALAKPSSASASASAARSSAPAARPAAAAAAAASSSSSSETSDDDNETQSAAVAAPASRSKPPPAAAAAAPAAAPQRASSIASVQPLSAASVSVRATPSKRPAPAAATAAAVASSSSSETSEDDDDASRAATASVVSRRPASAAAPAPATAPRTPAAAASLASLLLARKPAQAASAAASATAARAQAARSNIVF